VYVPADVTVADCVVAPVDHKKALYEPVERTTDAPHNESPVMVGAAKVVIETVLDAEHVLPNASVMVTVYVPADVTDLTWVVVPPDHKYDAAAEAVKSVEAQNVELPLIEQVNCCVFTTESVEKYKISTKALPTNLIVPVSATFNLIFTPLHEDTQPIEEKQGNTRVPLLVINLIVSPDAWIDK
jgi:hypothetical protein